MIMQCSECGSAELLAFKTFTRFWNLRNGEWEGGRTQDDGEPYCYTCDSCQHEWSSWESPTPEVEERA